MNKTARSRRCVTVVWPPPTHTHTRTLSAIPTLRGRRVAAANTHTKMVRITSRHRPDHRSHRRTPWREDTRRPLVASPWQSVVSPRRLPNPCPRGRPCPGLPSSPAVKQQKEKSKHARGKSNKNGGMPKYKRGLMKEALRASYDTSVQFESLCIIQLHECCPELLSVTYVPCPAWHLRGVCRILERVS